MKGMTNTRTPATPMDYFTTFCVFLLMLTLGKGQEDTSSSDHERVKDGRDAPRGRFPYMCSLRGRRRGGHICGGTLIDENWIMTAAHCLDPAKEAAGMTPVVYCNIYEREDRNETKRFRTTRCYLHHLWNGNALAGNDIALCHLTHSADDIPIPDLTNVGDAFGRGDIFSVVGWGIKNSRGDVADVLQLGSGLRFVPFSTCNAVEDWTGRIKDSMICAGEEGVDTCKGDSGGPLLLRHDPASTTEPEDPMLDLIVGITSFGDRSCKGEAPGVYTRVSCYRPWMRCIMQGTRQDCSVHFPCEEPSSGCSTIRGDPNFNENEALETIITALESDDSEAVEQILCDGLSPNSVLDKYQNSLLLVAARNDAVESAKVLLQQGAKIEYKNDLGQAALSRAAGFGSERMVQLLIDSGANLESKNDNGYTALSFAAFYNQLRVLKILLKNGANLESKTYAGWTPLHLSASKNSLGISEELITAGADVDSKREDGWTPLHLTAYQNAINVAKLLISNEADIEAKDESGWTPLYVAARFRAEEVAKELIANGARVDSRSDGRWTPLHAAAYNNSIDVAKELIANGANIQATTIFGDAPLAVASYYGSLSMVRLLLDENAIVDSPNEEEKTALHYAASRGHVAVVSALLHDGALRTSEDENGKTPFDVICARTSSNEPCRNDVVNTLRQLLEP